MLKRATAAAVVLQRNYRRGQWARLLRRQASALRNAGAAMIQKYLRGRRVRKEMLDLARRVHLGTHFAYFDQMRLRLLEDLQIRVRYHWKKHLKIKKEKALANAAKVRKSKPSAPKAMHHNARGTDDGPAPNNTYTARPLKAANKGRAANVRLHGQRNPPQA